MRKIPAGSEQAASSHSSSLERLYTEEELSDAGYGSRSKLRQDRVVGSGIPFVYVGTAVRYRESDVLAWLDSHRVTHALQRTGRRKSHGR
jgi:hypothetical protein